MRDDLHLFYLFFCLGELNLDASRIILGCFSGSGPGSRQRLPEAKETGGPHPAVGGTLAGVLPVNGELTRTLYFRRNQTASSKRLIEAASLFRVRRY